MAAKSGNSVGKLLHENIIFVSHTHFESKPSQTSFYRTFTGCKKYLIDAIDLKFGNMEVCWPHIRNISF